MELIVEASSRRVYANAHTYHINSISVNSDQETFISSDDLRINLWHHEVTSQSYNIVDIKPVNMEELTEVITAAEFHPKDCNLLAYSSSKGIIRLCDMRVSALCDGNPIIFFEEREDANNRSFFSEIISSVSDVKFSHNGQFILTRDYLTVNVWDIRQDAHPIETYNVHEYLRSKLCVLYENDSIFDKFECCWSGDDKHIVTGSYSNLFRTFRRGDPEGATFEASVDACDAPNSLLKKKSIPPAAGARRRKDDTSDNLDYSKKILHVSWHPNANIIALAATNNLYIFEGHTQRNALS